MCVCVVVGLCELHNSLEASIVNMECRIHSNSWKDTVRQLSVIDS